MRCNFVASIGLKRLERMKFLDASCRKLIEFCKELVCIETSSLTKISATSVLFSAAAILLFPQQLKSQVVTKSGRYVFTNVSAAIDSTAVPFTVRSSAWFTDTQTGRLRRCVATIVEPFSAAPQLTSSCVAWMSVDPARSLPGGTTYSVAIPGQSSLVQKQWDGLMWAVDDRSGRAFICLRTGPSSPTTMVKCYPVTQQ